MIIMVHKEKWHCVKSVQIPRFSWYVFFRIRNAYREILRISPHSVRTRYEISLRIQSECGKIRARTNSLFGHFSRSAVILRCAFFMMMSTLRSISYPGWCECRKVYLSFFCFKASVHFVKERALCK